MKITKIGSMQSKLPRTQLLKKNVDAYIKKVIKIGWKVDVPCYIDSKIVSEFSNEFSFPQALKEKNAGILQLLAVENIKHHKVIYCYLAASRNQLNLIKVLAPLLEYPNAPLMHDGYTPIHAAASMGHADVIKYLAPLTKNINTQGSWSGRTPIYLAAQNGHLDCIKVLAPLCENPNTPLLKAIFPEGKTPIQAAEKNGHDEIKKFLQSFL